ncbi:MAG: OmpA family protein [Bdellovibrionaceae bacterium]|nr:OmpA family protein [Pseudobdellovibrionaceae bacterium]
MLKTFIQYNLLILMVFYFSGCTSKQKLASMDPKSVELIETLKIKLNERKANSEHLVSPKLYEASKKILESSVKMASYGEPYLKVENKINEANYFLNKMDNNMDVAAFHISDVIDQRNEAQREGAENSDLFNDADKYFMSLGEKLENGNINAVIKGKNKLMKLYERAEIEAIQNRELNIARKNLKKASSLSGFRQFLDLEDHTIKKIEAAEKLININKDSEENYLPGVKEAIESSQVLLARVETASWIKNNKARDVTLQIEKDLNNISLNMDKMSLYKYPYTQKISYLSKAAKELPLLQHELESTRNKANTNEDRLSSLETQNMDLNSKVRAELQLKDNLDYVQSLFKSNEAEIVRKDNDLIIRLVGLSFPVNKSTVVGNSEPILEKVARAINKFSPNNIEVQGHTDTIGSAIHNERLSEERASNVVNFLVKETGLPSSAFDSIGYGFRRPITENKTPVGRKKNRRIDIVIKSVVQ